MKRAGHEKLIGKPSDPVSGGEGDHITLQMIYGFQGRISTPFAESVLTDATGMTTTVRRIEHRGGLVVETELLTRRAASAQRP